MSVLVKRVDTNIDGKMFARCAAKLGYSTHTNADAIDYYGNVAAKNCTTVTVGGSKMNIAITEDGGLIFDHMLEDHVGKILSTYHEENVTTRLRQSQFKVFKRVESKDKITLTVRRG